MKFHAVLRLYLLFVRSSSTYLRSPKAEEAQHLAKDAVSRSLVENLELAKATSVSLDVEPPPTLNFLFMALDKLPHKTIWEQFFQNRATGGGAFRAFVHCKNEKICQDDLKEHPVFSLIETVETEYCFGLVAAMNKLLQAAIDAGTGHRNDKFVFASETTLPVKPFQFVYRHLTADDDSHFCFFPVKWLRWSEDDSVGSIFAGVFTGFTSWLAAIEDEVFPVQHRGKERLAPKHHQWMVLSRRHALLATRRAQMFPQLLSDLGVNHPGKASGCSDEFWHFNTLYDGVNVTDLSATSLVEVDGIANGDLRYDAHEPQGQCDTFVYWQSKDDGTAGPARSLGRRLEADAFTHLSHKAGHPCEISELGESSIRALRESAFLFARKIMPGTRVHSAAVPGSLALTATETLEEAFARLVFRP